MADKKDDKDKVSNWGEWWESATAPTGSLGELGRAFDRLVGTDIYDEEKQIKEYEAATDKKYLTPQEIEAIPNSEEKRRVRAGQQDVVANLDDNVADIAAGLSNTMGSAWVGAGELGRQASIGGDPLGAADKLGKVAINAVRDMGGGIVRGYAEDVGFTLPPTENPTYKDISTVDALSGLASDLGDAFGLMKDAKFDSDTYLTKWHDRPGDVLLDVIPAVGAAKGVAKATQAEAALARATEAIKDAAISADVAVPALPVLPATSPAAALAGAALSGLGDVFLPVNTGLTRKMPFGDAFKRGVIVAEDTKRAPMLSREANGPIVQALKDIQEQKNMSKYEVSPNNSNLFGPKPNALESAWQSPYTTLLAQGLFDSYTRAAPKTLEGLKARTDFLESSPMAKILMPLEKGDYKAARKAFDEHAPGVDSSFISKLEVPGLSDAAKKDIISDALGNLEVFQRNKAYANKALFDALLQPQIPTFNEKGFLPAVYKRVSAKPVKGYVDITDSELYRNLPELPGAKKIEGERAFMHEPTWRAIQRAEKGLVSPQTESAAASFFGDYRNAWGGMKITGSPAAYIHNMMSTLLFSTADSGLIRGAAKTIKDQGERVVSNLDTNKTLGKLTADDPYLKLSEEWGLYGSTELPNKSMAKEIVDISNKTNDRVMLDLAKAAAKLAGNPIRGSAALVGKIPGLAFVDKTAGWAGTQLGNVFGAFDGAVKTNIMKNTLQDFYFLNKEKFADLGIKNEADFVKRVGIVPPNASSAEKALMEAAKKAALARVQMLLPNYENNPGLLKAMDKYGLAVFANYVFANRKTYLEMLKTDTLKTINAQKNLRGDQDFVEKITPDYIGGEAVQSPFGKGYIATKSMNPLPSRSLMSLLVPYGTNLQGTSNYQDFADAKYQDLSAPDVIPGGPFKDIYHLLTGKNAYDQPLAGDEPWEVAKGMALPSSLNKYRQNEGVKERRAAIEKADPSDERLALDEERMKEGLKPRLTPKKWPEFIRSMIDMETRPYKNVERDEVSKVKDVERQLEFIKQMYLSGKITEEEWGRMSDQLVKDSGIE
jgi:hypothetical protein